VPRNQGPWFGYIPISDWVPKLLRGIAQQLSGEAASMTLRELIVNENLISASMTSR
jgi:hypothetical protein